MLIRPWTERLYPLRVQTHRFQVPLIVNDVSFVHFLKMVTVRVPRLENFGRVGRTPGVTRIFFTDFCFLINPSPRETREEKTESNLTTTIKRGRTIFLTEFSKLIVQIKRTYSSRSSCGSQIQR